jgi:hypothetical protein
VVATERRWIDGSESESEELRVNVSEKEKRKRVSQFGKWRVVVQVVGRNWEGTVGR